MSAPERGPLVWTDFDPRRGEEQEGRRPALVISSGQYNRVTGLLVCLHVTSRVEGYLTELPLPPGLGARGVILTSHVYTLDWQARGWRPLSPFPGTFWKKPWTG
ncbi:type II toxin-antitoxin system PemK/MazF family toxin [Deinococcus apachensis]|uniref:type II toxin-antitoxin system PemK/MazF family toxin n=1 Tax=Deinococcus apachensis TaxID=309886 RepID=UPI0003A3D4AF|nr:type II toxin-antitoxin system PemK/MazF family toxin [Deinococcus apachensis]